MDLEEEEEAAMAAVAIMVVAMAVVATVVAMAVVAAVVAMAVAAMAIIAAAMAAVAIVPPVHGAGKTAAMAPAITLGRAMPTTKGAAVVAVDRPVAVAMTIPVTAELRADLSR